MTVTPDQARMLTALAIAARPHGARRWDSAGVMAAIKAISTWSLAEAMVEVATAAADRDAETPAVIGKQGRRWQANVTAEPTYRAGQRWCTRCGVQEGPHQIKSDHVFEPPVPKESKLTPEATKRTVAALKEQIVPMPPQPEPIPLAERIAALPRDPALEAVRAALAGEASETEEAVS